MLLTERRSKKPYADACLWRILSENITSDFEVSLGMLFLFALVQILRLNALPKLVKWFNQGPLNLLGGSK